MFDYPYLIELLSPPSDAGLKKKELLDRFSMRYKLAIEYDCGISVPDNPMGRPRMSLIDCITDLGLGVNAEKIVMNLNTFHQKDELDALLIRASAIGITNLLIIRGDGGPDLSKLAPASIGGKHSVATTIDLLNYINSEYHGRFQTGVAFNPYKPLSFEEKHLQRKIDAGAKFIITQPIIERNKNVDSITNKGLPIVVEAWMSTRVSLFLKSIGKSDSGVKENYDPIQNLEQLHGEYPGACVYLAMFDFSRNWQSQLPQLNSQLSYKQERTDSYCQ